MTDAAWGGLEPNPAARLRWAFLEICTGLCGAATGRPGYHLSMLLLTRVSARKWVSSKYSLDSQGFCGAKADGMCFALRPVGDSKRGWREQPAGRTGRPGSYPARCGTMTRSSLTTVSAYEGNWLRLGANLVLLLFRTRASGAGADSSQENAMLKRLVAAISGVGWSDLPPRLGEECRRTFPSTSTPSRGITRRRVPFAANVPGT